MIRQDCGWAALQGTSPELRLPAQAPELLTLLELVAAVAEFSASDGEVVAVVEHLLTSGRVRLIGQFRAPHLLPN